MKTLKGVIVAVGLLVAGSAHGFSDDALKRVDRSATYSVLAENPGAYAGKDLLLGGTVVNAGPDRIEVAELPLDARYRPIVSFTSLGRFVVTSRERLDPSLYRRGVLVTVIGTVTAGQGGVPVLAGREFQPWKEPAKAAAPPPDAYETVYEDDEEYLDDGYVDDGVDEEYVYDGYVPSYYPYPYYYPYAYPSYYPYYPWSYGGSLFFGFGGGGRDHFGSGRGHSGGGGHGGRGGHMRGGR
jgi:outer membrane lipoprotein